MGLFGNKEKDLYDPKIEEEKRKNIAIERVQGLLKQFEVALSIGTYWKLECVHGIGDVGLEGDGKKAFIALRDLVQGLERFGLVIGPYKYGQEAAFDKSRFQATEVIEPGTKVYVVEPELGASWEASGYGQGKGYMIAKLAMVSTEPPKESQI